MSFPSASTAEQKGRRSTSPALAGEDVYARMYMQCDDPQESPLLCSHRFKLELSIALPRAWLKSWKSLTCKHLTDSEIRRHLKNNPWHYFLSHDIWSNHTASMTLTDALKRLKMPRRGIYSCNRKDNFLECGKVYDTAELKNRQISWQNGLLHSF